MYKLYFKKEEAVKLKGAKYFLRNIDDGSYLDADDTIVFAMIGKGEVINATLENGSIIECSTEEVNKASGIIRDIYNRLSPPNSVNGPLYCVEESFMSQSPTAVLSIDPYRRVLATLECEVKKEKYFKAIENTFLSYRIIQLFDTLKSCIKGEDKLLGVGNYHDSISEFHAVCFEGSSGMREYYPCEPSNDSWKQNVKFHICPKERMKKPTDMPKELYMASALVVQMLEEQQDIYCSPCGEVLYLHRK